MIKEFALSDAIPEAVSETDLHRAKAGWQRRSDEAAAKVKMPSAPYRIRGDSKENGWFVERAEIRRSAEPAEDWRGSLHDSMLYSLARFGRLGEADLATLSRHREEQARAMVEKYNAAKPKAKLVWKSMALDDDDGDATCPASFRTYAEAVKWLREELEPVRDESVYFTEDGREAA